VERTDIPSAIDPALFDRAVEVRPETDPMIKLIPLAVLGFGLGACVATTPPAYLAAPADPSVGVRTPGYASVTAGVRNYDVVEPLDWRELNRRVAPGTNPERGDSDDAARRGR
jgi:hypothetical protein